MKLLAIHHFPWRNGWKSLNYTTLSTKALCRSSRSGGIMTSRFLVKKMWPWLTFAIVWFADNCAFFCTTVTSRASWQWTMQRSSLPKGWSYFRSESIRVKYCPVTGERPVTRKSWKRCKNINRPSFGRTITKSDREQLESLCQRRSVMSIVSCDSVLRGSWADFPPFFYFD